MEERRKYQVGTENETPETEKTSLLNMTLEHLADFWARLIAPVTIDRTIVKNGRKVRIRVEEADE